MGPWDQAWAVDGGLQGLKGRGLGRRPEFWSGGPIGAPKGHLILASEVGAYGGIDFGPNMDLISGLGLSLER